MLSCSTNLLFWFWFRPRNLIIAEQPAHCAFSVRYELAYAPLTAQDYLSNEPTHLPLLKIVLLRLVLLHQIFQHLSKSFLVSLEGWDYILDGPLDKYSIDKAEALSILRKGF